MKNIKIIVLCFLFLFSSCRYKQERKFFEKYYDKGIDKDLITEDNIKSLVFDHFFYWKRRLLVIFCR